MLMYFVPNKQRPELEAVHSGEPLRDILHSTREEVCMFGMGKYGAAFRSHRPPD